MAKDYPTASPGPAAVTSDWAFKRASDLDSLTLWHRHRPRRDELAVGGGTARACGKSGEVGPRRVHDRAEHAGARGGDGVAAVGGGCQIDAVRLRAYSAV